MKQLIRDWLGIKTGLGKEEKTYIDNRIKEAVGSVFEEEDYLVDLWAKDDLSRMRGFVERLIRETLRKEAKNKINEVVDPESFIDDVVERIKVKQL